MKKFRAGQLDAFLRTVALAFLFLWQSSVAAQTVTWQALPFPVTSDWPGPFGQSATIGVNSIVLQGQPARTVESFTSAFTLACDVQLASRLTDDGAFTVYLLEPGQPTDTDPAAGLALQLIYSNTGGFGSVDRLQISQLNGPSLWTDPDFHLAGGTTYHLTLAVADTGTLNLDIVGTSYSIPTDLTYSSAQAQIQLGGWQPNDIWTVSNFVLVPEPSADTFLGASLMGLAGLAGIRWNSRRRVNFTNRWN